MNQLKAILLILACVSGIKSDAAVVFDYLGPVRVLPSGVERNLFVSSSARGIYNLSVIPIQDALRSSDGKNVIPLENVYLNNNEEDLFFKYNREMCLFKRWEAGTVNKNIIAKIRGIGVVPAGIYNLTLEIRAQDADTGVLVTTSTFDLQFEVLPEQKLMFFEQRPKINVNVNNVMEKNRKFLSQTNPQVRIISNTPWVLSVINDFDDKQPGDFYIRTVGASANVRERLLDRVRLDKGKEVVVAKGGATSNSEYVSIEYSVEGQNNKSLVPGEYSNNIKFVLREDRSI